MGTGCENLIGKPLLHSYTWSFRTRPAPASITEGAGPHVTSMFPAAYSTNVSVACLNGVPIALNFSGAVAATTLTTDTVHVRRRGVGTDEDVTLSYNASAHRLDILLNNGAMVNTRYEITLDAANILSAATPAQPLQGDTRFVFTTQTSTAPPMSPTPVHPLGGGGGPAGGGPAGGGGSPDPQEPPPLTLSVTYGDGDAGAYATVDITTPDGGTQSFATETVTDDYRTMDLPEVPDGSEVVITPGFTKGSDKNKDHHEEGEISVQMLRSGQSANDGSTYTTFLLAGNEVKSARPLGGSASFENADKQLEKLKTKKVVIDPVAADKGRLGDIVPSNNQDSKDPNVKPERHFVTPRSNEHLTDEYATFEVNVTDAEFAKLKWADDSDGVAGDTEKQRNVSRSGPAKHVLKLNYKDSSIEAAKLNAWVVYCETSVVPGVAEWLPKFLNVGADYWIKKNPKVGWKFTFTIRPKAIIDTAEHPYLEYSPVKDVPGAGKPYFARSGYDSDYAKDKWDVSRKVHAVIYNPQLIDKSLFPAEPIYARQPLAVDELAAFPTIDAEGNDDPSFSSQDTNAYDASATGDITDHQKGQICSYDALRSKFLRFGVKPPSPSSYMRTSRNLPASSCGMARGRPQYSGFVCLTFTNGIIT